MNIDLIRSFWTRGNAAKYWATAPAPAFKGAALLPHQQRWAKAHNSSARGLYRSQYLSNTAIF